MRLPRRLLSTLLPLLVACGADDSDDGAPDLSSRSALTDGWVIRSAAEVAADGAALSTPGAATDGWIPAAVPGTVVGALVTAGVYADPFVGRQFRDLPGMGYPSGGDFSIYEIPDDSPFAVPWWYRTEFTVPAGAAGRRVWLRFEGINYRAEIWLDGERIAGPDTVVGTFRRFEFDVTDRVRPGAASALAVRVTAPELGALAITWVDWNPHPPDKDMGLWDEVLLLTSGPVALRRPRVVPDLDLPSLDVARIAVSAELVNGADTAIAGTLVARLETLEVARPVSLEAGASRRVGLPELVVDRPRIWWPRDLGSPELYDLELEFRAAGRISDARTVRFGVREVGATRTEDDHLLFEVNGEPVLIRGAGYTPDVFLRRDAARDRAEIAYVDDLGLNALRNEGKLGNEHLLALLDERGLLYLPGWCCCDFWEMQALWDEEDWRVARASTVDQLAALVNHPSVIAWFYGSDVPPQADVERLYLDTLDEVEWPLPHVSSANDQAAPLTGWPGVKMTGPYEWVPPGYWLEDTENGGAWGFNTETSPGPAPPRIESLRRFLPPEHLWPIDEVWSFHAGGGAFKDIDVFREALAARHGPPADLADFDRKAQLMAYEGIRAMFEAYGARKYTATGVIQWMLNDPWPSVIWHLYDYYLKPAGGYFGAKKALEPRHVQYRTDDRAVVVVNSTLTGASGLVVEARVVTTDLSAVWADRATVDLPPDGVVLALIVPAELEVAGAYLLRLTLRDAAGVLVSRNLYWLAPQMDVLDHAAAEWYVTPVREYADLTGLDDLPPATLAVSGTAAAAPEGEATATITLRNDSAGLAFFVRVEVTAGEGGPEVLPVRYTDNRVTVWPGEARTITARYAVADLDGASAALRVAGYNLAEMQVPLSR